MNHRTEVLDALSYFRKFAVRGPYMLARIMNIFNNESLFQTMSDQNHYKNFYNL